MSTLDEVEAEVTRWDASRPRSQQISLGASDLFGCRAQKLLKLTGVPQSNPRLSWQALVGTAVHAVFEKAAPAGVITEQRFEYRGVWATVDRYDPNTAKLTDFKGKDNKQAITKVAKSGPSLGHQAQVHVGAAALIQAGFDVQTVEILYFPRAGAFTGAYLWSSYFDRELADAAVEWAAEQTGRAAWHDSTSAPNALDGLRDEDARFCRSYCEWHDVCRGAA